MDSDGAYVIRAPERRVAHIHEGGADGEERSVSEREVVWRVHGVEGRNAADQGTKLQPKRRGKRRKKKKEKKDEGQVADQPKLIFKGRT
jgi:hypothetical protein